MMRKDVEGDFWEAIGIGFVAGLIGQYIGDVMNNIQTGVVGIDIVLPTSSAKEYLASGIGGAIASIPGLNLAGTMGVGAIGSIVTDAMKGNIEDVNDVVESVTWGAGANAVGYIVSRSIAVAKVSQIDDMTRSSQKRFLNEHIYKDSRAKININYHSYMANDIRGKVNIVEKSLIGFRAGIYSTTMSTIATTFR